MTDLENLIIEDLIDSDFDPSIHEAYAWTLDIWGDDEGYMPRTTSYMYRQLNNIDWDKIENAVKKVRDES